MLHPAHKSWDAAASDLGVSGPPGREKTTEDAGLLRCSTSSTSLGGEFVMDREISPCVRWVDEEFREESSDDGFDDMVTEEVVIFDSVERLGSRFGVAGLSSELLEWS